MSANTKYKHLITLGILGDENVGKKHLMFRFTEDKFGVFYPFVGTYYGPHWEEKDVQIGNDKVRVKILHPRRFERNVVSKWSYLRGQRAVVVCYAVNNRESFQNVEKWMELLNDYGSKEASIVLAATKCDVSDRCIEYEEGKQLADKYGIKLFEVSSKEDIYVQEMFFELVTQAKEVIERNSTNLKIGEITTTTRNSCF